jgi:hypothetical protein
MEKPRYDNVIPVWGDRLAKVIKGVQMNRSDRQSRFRTSLGQRASIFGARRKSATENHAKVIVQTGSVSWKLNGLHLAWSS